ncbi:MAG: putative DNA modification/repair radical SAM protein [Thermaurantiacus tibetensis]|uniref:putative DNA modification/repair radical SAM protein n=1 Tax=Thermaurantiacus tibetensis TaxID=2759035 RepID=UPI00188F126B|nr:putative DNA modification/repair radical SAM protein [Thermaurantiacus tibetensis]
MPALSLREKLEILADAAKYDASCASSGTSRRTALGGRGMGSTEGMGICHSYAPDGRCISLLKILLTNFCQYDCAFCINRRSSSVRRARFTVDEVVRLTLGFYARNYIEGLFLSSGIIRSPDYTMEELVRVARTLREEHDFRGYIHLKTIPDASPELVREAGLYADRLSINIELPSAESLRALAPEKDAGRIEGSMAVLGERIAEARDASRRFAHAPRFAPAGQSTQMIVGADAADDLAILATADGLYRRHAMRRVYYSAYSPIPDASASLPPSPPPLAREHRLYQADWMLRFYGFTLQEIAAAAPGGRLPLEHDPKLAWALRHRDRFPVDVNRAPRELLLRVPGLGPKVVGRILLSRRHRTLRWADLARLVASPAKVKPFVTTPDWRPTALLDTADPLAPPPRQLSLFG